MIQQPPIVLECPECGEKYLISRESNNPSEKAVLYSDGFFFDETNWRTPNIIGCVTCELGFFPQNGKVIAEPDWDEFHERWAQIKKAEAPTAGALALELRARRNINMLDEIALRIEFWYSGHHAETGRLLLSKNQKFKQFWNENLIKLETILPSEPNIQLMIKAEINRQLGNFEKCVDLLSSDNSFFAEQIIEQALQHNSSLFKFANA